MDKLFEFLNTLANKSKAGLIFAMLLVQLAIAGGAVASYDKLIASPREKAIKEIEDSHYKELLEQFKEIKSDLRTANQNILNLASKK
jgi:hypothetical protein